MNDEVHDTSFSFAALTARFAVLFACSPALRARFESISSKLCLPTKDRGTLADHNLSGHVRSARPAEMPAFLAGKAPREPARYRIRVAFTGVSAGYVRVRVARGEFGERLMDCHERFRASTEIWVSFTCPCTKGTTDFGVARGLIDPQYGMPVAHRCCIVRRDR